MTALPPAGHFSNVNRTNGEAKQAQDDTLAFIRQLTGTQAASDLVISAGSVTPNRGWHALDTEAAAPADDLTHLDQTNLPDGLQTVLTSKNAARDITVKHNAGGVGEILLASLGDFLLDDPGKWLRLRREGTTWVEVDRSYGADAAAERTFLGLGSAATKAAAEIPAAGGIPLIKVGGQLDPAVVPSSSSAPTGAMTSYVGVVAPSGYVLADGGTIGKSGSGATTRANADTQALFELLWNDHPDSILAVSGGRGVDATADFNAAKKIAIPDMRGRVAVGKDDMGGTAANRITSGAKAGIDGAQIGASGGVEEHAITTPEMASHTHGFTAPSGDNNMHDSFETSGPHTSSASVTGAAGGDEPHTNMQPSWVASWIIRL